jgi:hypothetical protein
MVRPRFGVNLLRENKMANGNNDNKTIYEMLSTFGEKSGKHDELLGLISTELDQLKSVAENEFGGHTWTGKLSVDNLRKIKSGLDESQLKLVTMKDWMNRPDQDNPNVITDVDYLDELANSLRINIMGEMDMRFSEEWTGKNGKIEGKVLENTLSNVLTGQSPYSDIGTMWNFEEDMVKGTHDDHFAYTSELQGRGGEGTGQFGELLSPIEVSPKKSGMMGYLQRLLPGGKTGYR